MQRNISLLFIPLGVAEKKKIFKMTWVKWGHANLVSKNVKNLQTSEKVAKMNFIPSEAKF